MPQLSSLSRSVAGRVAVVTGAGSGLGRATAHLLADEGALVGVLDRDAEAVADVVGAIRDAGGRAAGCVVDVRSDGEIRAAVDVVRAELGPVDIVVNNAGVSLPSPIGDDGFDLAWDATLAVNLTAPARMVRACLADLGRDGAGRVVNIASTEGLGATPGIAAYTASKHGVIGLTRALAVELGRRGITVNCVCPGPMHTDMTASIPDEAKATFARRRVPVGRYADPEEVAHAVLSLVVPASSFVNGAVLVVDGGLTAQNT